MISILFLINVLSRMAVMYIICYMHASGYFHKYEGNTLKNRILTYCIMVCVISGMLLIGNTFL